MKNIYFTTLILLLALLSLGALLGGGAMIIDPSGELLQMPLSMLEKTALNSFLVPGIILFTLFGLLPILLIWSLLKMSENQFMESLNILKDMHWAWTFVIYIGFGLIIWIQIQIQMIKEVHWVHDLYTYWAIFILALALMPGVRKKFRKIS